MKQKVNQTWQMKLYGKREVTGKIVRINKNAISFHNNEYEHRVHTTYQLKDVEFLKEVK